MDTEDLLPRLALFGGLVAALVVYRRSRAGKLRNVQSQLAAVPGKVADAAKAGVEVSVPTKSMIEGVLDNVAEQALKELKTVLKDGLHRLDKMIDEL